MALSHRFQSTAYGMYDNNKIGLKQQQKTVILLFQ